VSFVDEASDILAIEAFEKRTDFEFTKPSGTSIEEQLTLVENDAAQSRLGSIEIDKMHIPSGYNGKRSESVERISIETSHRLGISGKNGNIEVAVLTQLAACGRAEDERRSDARIIEKCLCEFVHQ